MASADGASASVYKHGKEAVQRPDVGVEAQFSNKKAPKTHRYDSSLSPELTWDESAERAYAEWLLTLIVAAADQGEAAVVHSDAGRAGERRKFWLSVAMRSAIAEPDQAVPELGRESRTPADHGANAAAVCA